jgi:hypothetical protein
VGQNAVAWCTPLPPPHVYRRGWFRSALPADDAHKPRRLRDLRHHAEGHREDGNV